MWGASKIISEFGNATGSHILPKHSEQRNLDTVPTKRIGTALLGYKRRQHPKKAQQLEKKITRQESATTGKKMTPQESAATRENRLSCIRTCACHSFILVNQVSGLKLSFPADSCWAGRGGSIQITERLAALAISGPCQHKFRKHHSPKAEQFRHETKQTAHVNMFPQC